MSTTERFRPGAPTVLLLLAVWMAMFAGAFENTGMKPSYPSLLQELGEGVDISVFSTIFMVGGFVSAMLLARYIQKERAVPLFLIFTGIQTVGLVLCFFSTSLPMFLLGRLVQGTGEGVVVACVFFCISTLLPAGKPRSLGYASISVAWLTSSLLTPAFYWAIPVATWRFVIAVLIAICVASAILAFLGRRAMTTQGSSPSASKTKRPLAGSTVLQVLLLAVVLFIFSQFAGRIPNAVVACAIGTLVLSVVIFSTFRSGKGLLTIRQEVRRFVFVRAVVSAVYSAGLSFASIALIIGADSSSVRIAIVTSLAAVGWTTGSILQSRLRARAGNQLGGGLGALAIGLIGFIAAVLLGQDWVGGFGLFLAGVGIGVASNALPGFVSEAVEESELAESLTGLEIVDTVATTVVLVAVGAILAANAGSPSEQPALLAIYGLLAAAAIAAAVWIFRAKDQNSAGDDDLPIDTMAQEA